MTSVQCIGNSALVKATKILNKHSVLGSLSQEGLDKSDDASVGNERGSSSSYVDQRCHIFYLCGRETVDIRLGLVAMDLHLEHKGIQLNC